jgi:hypothetical protein
LLILDTVLRQTDLPAEYLFQHAHMQPVLPLTHVKLRLREYALE